MRRDKEKITDQSEVLFKQKRWFKTKTNDPVASRLEMGLKSNSIRHPIGYYRPRLIRLGSAVSRNPFSKYRHGN